LMAIADKVRLASRMRQNTIVGPRQWCPDRL
jgi:hypothetical protein